MSASFSDLAATHDLEDVSGCSPDGLEEQRYLYSKDTRYRYAFARRSWPELPTLGLLLVPRSG